MKKLIASLFALALAVPAAAVAAPVDEVNNTIGMEAGILELPSGDEDYSGVRLEFNGVKSAFTYDARFKVGKAGDEDINSADISVGYLAFGDILGPKARYYYLDNGPRTEKVAMAGVGFYARPQSNVLLYSHALIGSDTVSTMIGGELGLTPKFALLGEVEALEIDQEISTFAQAGARYNVDSIGSFDFKVRYYEEGMTGGVKGTVGSLGLTVKF